MAQERWDGTGNYLEHLKGFDVKVRLIQGELLEGQIESVSTDSFILEGFDNRANQKGIYKRYMMTWVIFNSAVMYIEQGKECGNATY